MQTKIFAQEFEEINIESNKESINCNCLLHERVNFTMGGGMTYAQMHQSSLLGLRIHFKFLLGKKKRHRFGFDGNTLFGLNYIEGDSITYSSFYNVINTVSKYRITMVRFNLNYDFYILPPKLNGYGLRIGISGGVGINSADYEHNRGPFLGTDGVGWQIDSPIALEYRWCNYFGIYGELTFGYTSLSPSLGGIKVLDRFMVTATIGVSFDFRLYIPFFKSN